MAEWISVKERLPEDDKYNGTVLATDGSIVITAPPSSVTEDGFITHWMPLPQPPKKVVPKPPEEVLPYINKDGKAYFPRKRKAHD